MSHCKTLVYSIPALADNQQQVHILGDSYLALSSMTCGQMPQREKKQISNMEILSYWVGPDQGRGGYSKGSHVHTKYLKADRYVLHIKLFFLMCI